MTTLTRTALDALCIPRAHRSTDVDWRDLEAHLAREAEVGLDINPDYQRGHVWTPAQQVAYVEHILLGGETAREVMTVCVGRGTDDYVTARDGSISLRRYSLLDGLQRVTAVRAFVADAFPVLTSVDPAGFRWSQLDRSIQRRDLSFSWRSLAVPTEADVIRLYLRLNSGGTPHSAAELDRVRAMLVTS